MSAIHRKQLAPGLYFVATPIGSARDITLRALDILASADVLAAEDTRSLRRLMEIHGIALDGRPLIAYHDHNGAAQRPRLMRAIEEGKSVAYASEAGTPLIADPGFQLSREVAQSGALVTTAPGASAILAALTVAGLPTDKFLFAGFAPNSSGARRKFIAELRDIQATLVFYESPKRIHKFLDDLVSEFGPARQAVIARELTKKFEEVQRGTLQELVEMLRDRTLKGEIVVLVDRAKPPEIGQEELEERLKQAMQNASLKEAVATVTAQTGLPRRKIYQLALGLGGSE